ncbi:RICIN domain-containing protein [Hominenteromicrobium sp.]
MKKMLSLTLCVLMVFSMLIVGGAAETEVHAAGFTPRLTEPDASNSYYYSNMNPYWSVGLGMPNCTAYAWGRAYEILGERPKLSTGNGRDFWGYNDGYQRGSVPKLGAIACWDFGTWGHVAVVEKIEGNRVTLSESDYVQKINFRTVTMNADSSDYYSGFQGYIYIGDFGDTRTPVDVGTNFYAAIINTALWSTLTNDDRNVSIRKNAEQDRQIWYFERQGDGSYKISSYKDGLVLDAENSGTNPGTNIGVWEDKGADNQRWYIYGESGKYVFKPKYCDLVMDVYNGISDEGTNVQLWTENGEYAQLFQIWKVIPDATTVYSTAGSDCQPTKIWWDKANEATEYTVKIWNGPYTEGEPYKVLWGVKDLSCEVDLPAGYYEAYVDSANKWHYTRSSNVVQFTVAEGGHTFGEWTLTTEPTCTSMGKEERTCTSCGKTESRVVEMTAHPWSEAYTVQIAPTCTSTGLEARVCTACGAIDPDSYRDIPANGHSFGEWTVTPGSSCTEGGSESRKCSVCGYTEVKDIDPTGHSWQTEYTVDKAPTCTEDGSESIHCENCDAIKDSRTIPAEGHSFGEWTTIKDVTCTENGEEEHVCDTCGYSEKRTVTAQGHSWETEYTVDVPATCTEDGVESIHCTNCDTVKDERKIPAPGHAWQSEFTVDLEPTETEEGRKSIHCEHCDAVKDVTSIPATGSGVKPTSKPSETPAPAEDLSYMLKIEGEDGIRITEGLKAAGVKTTEQVKEKLLACVLQNEGYTAENTDLFEVTLRVSKDDGYTWGDVSADSFPESGEVRVTLPYPKGAPKDTPKENYKVYHMFTQDVNGHKAGEIEACPVEKIDEGLVVTLHGLSPVMVAWKPVDEAAEPTAAPSTDPTSAPSAEPTAQPKPTAAPSAEPTAAPTEQPAGDAPKTGDSGVHVLWIAAVLLSGGAMTALVWAKRKKQ